MPCNRAIIENQPAIADFDSISGKPDDPLDQVRILLGVTKYDDIPAPWQYFENTSSNRREFKRKAVSRIAVRPFRHDQIVADIEGRKHRPRGDAERRRDKASERPSKNRDEEHEAKP